MFIFGLPYFGTILTLAQLLHAWSTSVTISCTTQTGKLLPVTKTLTTTRNEEYLITSTSTAIETVASAETTTTMTVTKLRDLDTATVTVTYFYDEYSFIIVDDRITETIPTITTTTTTTGHTTVTIPTPAGFTPIASIVTPPSKAVLAAEASGTATRIICHETHLRITTLTTTVRASTVATVTLTSILPIDYKFTTIYSTNSAPYTAIDDEISYLLTTYTETGTVDVTTYTTTTIATKRVPTATSYPACAPDNLLSNYNQQYNVSNYESAQNPLGFHFKGRDAKDCCIKCFLTPNCTGMAYTDAYCRLFYVLPGHTCDASKNADWSIVLSETQYTVFTVSNGPCGQAKAVFN